MLTARKANLSTITVSTKEKPKDPERGRRIADLREARGWTQEELAQKMGLGQGSSVSSWEAGAGIGDKNIRRLAEALGVSTDRILRGNPEHASVTVPRGTPTDGDGDKTPMELIHRDVGEYVTEAARLEEANPVFLELLRERITSNFRRYLSRWIKDDADLTDAVHDAVYMEIGPPRPSQSDLKQGRVNGKH